MNDPSTEIWYYLEISNKKNINLKKLKESEESSYKPYGGKAGMIKKRGKGTLTFQVCKHEDKQNRFKKDTKLRMNSYDCWSLLIDKMKECPNFYINQRFFFEYLKSYIRKELKQYKKVEKLVKIVNKIDEERKIERTAEESQFILHETAEIISKEKQSEFLRVFSEDDTIEILDNQNIIHTYALS